MNSASNGRVLFYGVIMDLQELSRELCKRTTISKKTQIFLLPFAGRVHPDAVDLLAKFTGTKASEACQMAEVSEPALWNLTCSLLRQPSTT